MKTLAPLPKFIVEVRDNFDYSSSRARLGRIYISISNETLLENIANRKRRPIGEFRKIARAALDRLGYDSENVEIHWSQRAGCSCPCSPGFVIDDVRFIYKNIFVTI